ncbi:Ig-like domain-containing protein [uncultured Solobacterium sp.]|uniref:Ig-like domain-containing protein n=1 Tax=uncultured Solobacterium sp. TaxID=747375 RepID=UPI00262E44F2|nr:Ig-like domain-containing protein [uncultured Solobacterium sp.]
MKKRNYLAVVLSLFMTLTALIAWSKTNVIAEDGPKQVDATITNFRFMNLSRTNVGDIYYTDNFYFDLDWAANTTGATLKEGDYFTIDLPDTVMFSSDSSPIDFDIYDANGTGAVIAKAHITAGTNGATAKIVFTNWVENRYNVNGNIQLSARFDLTRVPVNQSTSFTVSVNAGKSNMTSSSGSVNVAGPQVLTDESLNKFAWYDTENPHLANWEIRINHKKATLSNVTIHDTIVGSTEKILKDTIRLSTVQMDQYGNDIAGTSTPVDLTGKLTMSDNDQTFTINVGNVNGEQYRLTYQSTYTEGTNLNNKLTLTSVNQTYTFDARFSRASSGGSGSGDLANKIKLTKVDEDDNTITLANAIFTVTKPDGTTFDLTTAADGTVTSEALVQGTYKVKEKTAPSGYELNDTEYTLEVTSAGGALQTITDKPIKTDISVTKTWVGPKAGPVTIHLFANGTDTGTTLTLDDSNNWTGSFSNVRKYDQSGTEIQYTVTEDAVNGYDSTITGDQTTGFTITNTEQPKNVNPPKQNATTPKTSDSTNIYLYFGMLFVGIITSGYLFAKRKSYR